MMWLIETKNPFSMLIEKYLVCAETEYEAKIKFTMEFPSFKVRSIVNKSEEVFQLL